MHGSIRANSKEGVGSTFTITLPLAGAAEGQPLTAPRQTPARATILYVEDNPANVSLMRHIINELGDVDLVVAPRPSEGIELAECSTPSLILLDINRPEMAGFDVLRVLKADRKTALIPVFALTANAMPREVDRGVAAGFDRYLTKPINVAQLLEAIEGVLPQP